MRTNWLVSIWWGTFLNGLSVIVSLIVRKKSITKTDDYRSACELFRSCSYDPNQIMSATRFQTFDTGPLILSPKRTIKKTHKALKITSLQFLTLFTPGVNKRAYILKQWNLFRNHSVIQNVMINTFLLIYAPKTSDWRFA